MDIPIEIETQDKFLANELLNSSQTRQGMQIELPSGAVLRTTRLLFRRGRTAGGNQPYSRFAEDVVAGLVAAWLYDKLKDKTSKLKIAEKPVEVERKVIPRLP